jgi:hypothetical protein
MDQITQTTSASAGLDAGFVEDTASIINNNEIKTSKNLEQALKLANMGVKIFPCREKEGAPYTNKEGDIVIPQRKDPYTAHGFNDASDDADQIVSYWSTWENALIGIACKPNGFLVLDVDNKNGKNGSKTLGELEDKNGNGVSLYDYAEAIQSTPNGGVHLFFKHPEGYILSKPDMLGEGLDLRSQAYVITGEGYEWIKPLQPPLTANIPEWLLNIILEKQKTPTNNYQGNFDNFIPPESRGKYIFEKYLDKILIDDYSRDRTCFDMCQQMNDNRIEKQEAMTWAEVFSQETTGIKDHPFTVSDAHKCCNSAYEKDKRAPWDIVEVEPTILPPEEFPDGWLSPLNAEEPPEGNPEAQGETDKSNIKEYYSTKNQARRDKLVVHTGLDTYKDIPPVEWLVEPLIAKKNFCMFFGKEGQGKTYSLLDLMVCLSQGLSWLDMKTKKCNVLLIDEEDGVDRTNRRLRRIRLGREVDIDESLQYFSFFGFHFDNFEDTALLEGYILEKNIEFVVIDPFAHVMVGDENSKQDVQLVGTNLKGIVERTGCTIVIIHHENKTGGYRGSTYLAGVVDINIQVSNNDKGLVTLDVRKNRDGVQGTSIYAQTYFSKNDDNEDVYRIVSSSGAGAKPLPKAQQFVINWITKHGATSIPDLEDNADICTSNEARKAVPILAEKDLIYRTNVGKPAIYDLIERKPVPSAQTTFV